MKKIFLLFLIPISQCCGGNTDQTITQTGKSFFSVFDVETKERLGVFARDTDTLTKPKGLWVLNVVTPEIRKALKTIKNNNCWAIKFPIKENQLNSNNNIKLIHKDLIILPRCPDIEKLHPYLTIHAIKLNDHENTREPEDKIFISIGYTS